MVRDLLVRCGARHPKGSGVRRTGSSSRIGYEGRLDYAATDTVSNLAARLCGEAGSSRRAFQKWGWHRPAPSLLYPRSAMAMTERHCGTCRFFAPAPLAGMGQCRCPSFAPPTDQHLVAAHDLACRRPGGDSWQPREEMAAASPVGTVSAADAPTVELPIVPTRAGRVRVR